MSMIQDPVRRPPASNNGNFIGMVAILLAMANLVGQVICGAIAGQGYTGATRIAGHTGFDMNDPAVAPQADRFGYGFLVWLLLWFGGLVPFILGILGVRKPPRAMGATAIVLSVAAPILAMIVFFIFAAPSFSYPS